jgi:deaminated glutathione amidase
MTPFAVAGIQMEVSYHRDQVSEMGRKVELLKLRFPWAQMVVFSELCAFGPSPMHARPIPGPVESYFCDLAAYHQVWLIPGSMFERVGDDTYNTTSVINPAGRVVTRYRKMFPFEPYENGVKPGTEFAAFDVPDVGRFGLSICYDMWFPETTRTLAAMGAEVILHPTMTDTIDRDVELSIARANAVINQCYFFDINGIGECGGGRSIVIDPSGHVLYQASAGLELIPIEIDLDRVRRERETGVRGLGQPLKSFRDRAVDFTVYQRGSAAERYLHSLGPLAKATPGSRAGLAPPPGAPIPERKELDIQPSHASGSEALIARIEGQLLGPPS